MPSRRKDLDPLGNYNFKVEIDGLVSGHFSAVEGLTREIEMIEYRVSDDPMTPRFRPGLPKYGRITLKRGYLANWDIYQWMMNVQAGRYEHKDVTIILHDNAGGYTDFWTLLRCLPTKWSTSGLDGRGTDALYESIELVVEEII